MTVIGGLLDQLSRKLQNIDYNNCEVFYRGLGDATWKDEPSIYRENRLKDEYQSVMDAITKFSDEFAYARSIDILTQLQHYQCPTRMLDVTSNFLVALFFACGGWEQKENVKEYHKLSSCEGAVRIYVVKKEDIKSIDSDTVTLLSNISRLKERGDFSQLIWACQKEQPAWQQNEELCQYAKDDVNKVVLVKTHLNNPRVKAQYGSFFLFGGLDLRNRYATNPKFTKSTVTLNNCTMANIIIPRLQKQQILKELEQYCKIDFTFMCPEKHDVIKNLISDNH